MCVSFLVADSVDGVSTSDGMYEDKWFIIKFSMHPTFISIGPVMVPSGRQKPRILFLVRPRTAPELRERVCTRFDFS